MGIWYNICIYTIRFIVGCIHECTADDRWSPLHTFAKVRCDMKKYIPALCLAVVTVLILLTAASRPYYPITRPYKCPYPVGSDEWIAIRESSSAPPVDEATTAKMSTKALILSYINYPDEYKFGYARLPRIVFQGMLNQSAVLREIMQRDDLVETLCGICADAEVPDFNYDELTEYEKIELEYQTNILYKLEFICARINLDRPVKKEAIELKAEIEKMVERIRASEYPFFSYYDILRLGNLDIDTRYVP